VLENEGGGEAEGTGARPLSRHGELSGAERGGAYVCHRCTMVLLGMTYDVGPKRRLVFLY
jgi:hypothetical protein